MSLSDGEMTANALHEIMAPCRYCQYAGAGYYQEKTHSKYCRWYLIGGMAARADIIKHEMKMKLTQLTVCSEDVMRTLPCTSEDAIISVVSPNAFHPRRTLKRDKTLYLKFHDLNPHGVRAEHLAPYKDGIMTQKHAEEIIQFVEDMKDRSLATEIQFPPNIIIHCEAGISRSPAIAMALSIIYGFQPTPSELYHMYSTYNEYVLTMVLNQWRIINAKKVILQSLDIF